MSGASTTSSFRHPLLLNLKYNGAVMVRLWGLSNSKVVLAVLDEELEGVGLTGERLSSWSMCHQFLNSARTRVFPFIEFFETNSSREGWLMMGVEFNSRSDNLTLFDIFRHD